MTNTDSVVGTPSYMAPEQASGSKELTPAADVYGLGATLYTLLTGQPPFLGRTALETMHRVLNDDPPRPRSRRPDVPRDLEAVCLKCLEKDPEMRYPSARALADDLARWREGKSTIARPQRWSSRAWRWIALKWRPLAVAALIAAVAILPALFNRQPEPKGKPEPDSKEKLEQAVASSLQRGEPVTLIGPTGPPRYYQWVIGIGTTEDQPGVPFKMGGMRTGMIQLLADSQTDRYRLSAEYCVETSLRPDCWAGIYFAHQRGAPGPNGTIDRAIVVRFRDDLINNKHGFPNGDPVSVNDALFIRGRVVLDGREVSHQFDLPSPASLWVLEKKGRYPGPLRQIVVEVTPESVRVLWRDATTGALVPVSPDPIPAWMFHKRTDKQAERVKTLAPTIDPGRLEFRPRGGLGLYSHNAGVIFKNVILEPLP
jgi:serine/threonine-protein kinase